jgi:hypothetical protein
MAKRKKWQPEEGEVTTVTTSESGESVPESKQVTLSLDEAKAIVNSAVQPAVPGEQFVRPSLELLDAAKAIVNAAVQPKAPV